MHGEIILLQETKITIEEDTKFATYCKPWTTLFHEACGIARGIGILWREESMPIELLKSRPD